MASRGNVVEQRLKLDTKDYRNGIASIKNSAKNAASGINKSFGSMQSGYKRTTESMKLDNMKLLKSMKQLGTDMVKGGAVVGAAAGFGALATSVSSAARATLNFDKDFQRLTQRFDFSKNKVKQLRDEYKKLAGQTGVVGSDILGAGNNLLSSTGGKSTDGLKQLAQFSKLSDNLSTEQTSRDVIDFLKGSGQDVSGANIESVLQSALSLNRKGDFSLSEALKLTTQTDANALSRAGLSNKENAALLAGASSVNQDRGSTSAAIQALIKKSVGGFGEGSALQGILGVSGGSLLSQGKFDVGKLGGAAKSFNSRGMSAEDSVALLQSGGLSETEAEGLYSILKDFDSFQETFDKTVKDQKTLQKAFEEGTNNMDDSLTKLRQKISDGVDDIVKPLSGVGNELIKGNFSKAAGMLPGAVGESAGGVMDNKLLAGATIGGLALSGGALRKLGLFGGAGGIAKGMAIDEATGGEVQPVYVTNISDINSSLGNLGGGKGGLMGKFKNMGKYALPLLGKGLGVGAAGAAGYGVGSLANEYLVEKTKKVDKSTGFEGNAVERFFNDMALAFGSDSAHKMKEANRIQLEIDSKDNGFKVRPKRNDKAVDVKGI